MARAASQMSENVCRPKFCHHWHHMSGNLFCPCLAIFLIHDSVFLIPKNVRSMYIRLPENPSNDQGSQSLAPKGRRFSSTKRGLSTSMIVAGRVNACCNRHHTLLRRLAARRSASSASSAGAEPKGSAASATAIEVGSEGSDGRKHGVKQIRMAKDGKG